MPVPRTRRQRQIYDYINEFIANRGHQPSYQQIANHFKLKSKGGIARHIVALEAQGFLTRRGGEDNEFCLLTNTPSASETQSVDITFIEWLEVPRADSDEEWLDEPLRVSSALLGYFSPDKIRAFVVANDAMEEKHICKGDIALVEEKEFARDGDIVVAVLEKNRSVMKTFYRVGAFVELQPANEKYETIRLSADKIKIAGVFRGLLRPLN